MKKIIEKVLVGSLWVGVFLSIWNFGSIGMLDLFRPETNIPMPLSGVAEDQNGSAVSSIKLELPPANNDFLPDLAIVYSSGSSPGLLGIGWNLSGLASVSNTGLTDTSGRPRFQSGFGGELVEKAPGIYHTKQESFHVHKRTTEGGWEILNPSGVLYSMGNRTDSKLQNQENEGLIWNLDRATNLLGNSYEIQYTEISNSIPIPQEIRYNESSIRVQFQYVPNLPVEEIYYLGRKVNKNVLIESIRVFIDGVETDSWEMVYDYPRQENNQFFAKLQSVKRKNFQPVLLTYQSSNSASYRFSAEKGPFAFCIVRHSTHTHQKQRKI